jgi:hypothetical protein
MKPSDFGVTFTNSARTAKKTPHITVTKTNRLTLFKEMIAVYCENHTKPVTNSQLLTVKAGGTYSYHYALTCQ